MTLEEKELLLKDICGRLPYGVKALFYDVEKNYISIIEGIDIYNFIKDNSGMESEISDVKPYLFPLSSMTEEQSKELEEIDPEFYSLICENGDICVSMDVRGYDWLNKNHFDYRGIIKKGLAIDATNLNIY